MSSACELTAAEDRALGISCSVTIIKKISVWHSLGEADLLQLWHSASPRRGTGKAHSELTKVRREAWLKACCYFSVQRRFPSLQLLQALCASFLRANKVFSQLWGKLPWLLQLGLCLSLEQGGVARQWYKVQRMSFSPVQCRVPLAGDQTLCSASNTVLCKFSLLVLLCSIAPACHVLGDCACHVAAACPGGLVREPRGHPLPTMLRGEAGTLQGTGRM